MEIKEKCKKIEKAQWAFIENGHFKNVQKAKSRPKLFQKCEKSI
jgi:hypothetical protein